MCEERSVSSSSVTIPKSGVWRSGINHMWNGEIAANGTKLTKWWLR